MRFLKAASLILCLILLLGLVLGASGTEFVGDCRGLDAAKPVGGSEKLLETSKAVLVYERTTGTLVYGYHIDDKIYPSSMVKLMTAIVALENGNLEDTVTVTRSALDSVAVGSVSAGLLRGEELTLENLLQLMMVGSANDAAAVIAEHIAGGQSAFVTMMNEKAKELGCTGTHFTNVHGLHEEENYTTARDILKILEYGLGMEVFKSMFETVSCTVPATNKSDDRTVTTTNNMMRPDRSKYYDKRVTGGKTGSTDAAGRCLAVTAKVGDMDVIALVMGAKATYSEDRQEILSHGSFEEMAVLLNEMSKQYECRQLYYEGQVISQYPVTNGSNNAVGISRENGFCVLPKGTLAEDLTWKYTASGSLTAPVTAGQQVGQLEIWLGDICLSRTALTALNGVNVYEPYSIPKGAEDDQDEQRHGEVLAMFLGIVFGLAFLVIGGVFLIRFARRAILRARMRRRRRNRRRNRNARVE